MRIKINSLKGSLTKKRFCEGEVNELSKFKIAEKSLKAFPSKFIILKKAQKVLKNEFSQRSAAKSLLNKALFDSDRQFIGGGVVLILIVEFSKLRCFERR